MGQVKIDIFEIVLSGSPDDEISIKHLNILPLNRYTARPKEIDKIRCVWLTILTFKNGPERLRR